MVRLSYCPDCRKDIKNVGFCPCENPQSTPINKIDKESIESKQFTIRNKSDSNYNSGF
jgi:hypothetical protein